MKNKNKLLAVLAVIAVIATGCTAEVDIKTETVSQITSELTSEQTEITTETESEQEEIDMEQFKDMIVELPPSGYEDKREGVKYSEFQKHTYFSATAGRDTNVNILLPPDYSEDKEYPVLYILHGFYDNEDWMTRSTVNLSTIYGNLLAEDKAKATDSTTKYYPKCPECKYSYVENETEDLTSCPECNAARKVRFNAWYTEDQYEILMDITTPERGKFQFLFDNCKGFNSDLSNIFEGTGESSLLDGPLYYDISFTQLREENYNMIESILDEYRERMAEGA